jgi:hypothetical protein
MYRFFCIIICALCLVSTSLVFAQRDPEVDKPKPKVKAPTKPRRIVGPVKAQNRGDGVLFVLTDPPVAQVLIKSGNATIRQGRSKDGEFRAELPPGLYEVEVTSQQYKPFVTKASVQPVGTKPVQADLVPTTGSILIGLSSIDTDVKLLIDGRKPTTVEKRGENQIEIENLPVGTHTLSISHPTIVAWERKVEVGGGATTTVTPKFSLAIVNLTIKSEPGADVSVDETYYGRVAENGELRIFNKLGPGEHSIQVSKDKFETGRLTRRFSVGNETLEMRLKRKVFSEGFADQFLGGASEWDLPKSWQVTKGKMRVRAATAGAAVGFVRDKEYADFKASFDFSFVNGKGAAWIIRARDKQNYYLFHLVGPTGAGRNMFHSFIVQDGQIKQLKPPEFLALNLSGQNASFLISIEATGSSIKHFIEISNDPQSTGRRPLSVLTDSTFSSGTMGFTSRDGEEFIVQFVSIEPTK